MRKRGFINRDKYRVRIYGKSNNVINLERKSKRNNVTFKTKCSISQAEYEKLRIGEIAWMKNDDRALILDLYHEMNYNQLRPTTVVDYERSLYLSVWQCACDI